MSGKSLATRARKTGESRGKQKAAEAIRPKSPGQGPATAKAADWTLALLCGLLCRA